MPHRQVNSAGVRHRRRRTAFGALSFALVAASFSLFATGCGNKELDNKVDESTLPAKPASGGPTASGPAQNAAPAQATY